MKLETLIIILIFIVEVDVLECGDIYRPVQFRSYNGFKLQDRYKWPWVVAFFRKDTGSFFCSGSLVSTKKVVSGELCQYDPRIVKLFKKEGR